MRHNNKKQVWTKQLVLQVQHCLIRGETFITWFTAFLLPHFINCFFISAVALALMGLTAVLLTISRTKRKSTSCCSRRRAAGTLTSFKMHTLWVRREHTPLSASEEETERGWEEVWACGSRIWRQVNTQVASTFSFFLEAAEENEIAYRFLSNTTNTDLLVKQTAGVKLHPRCEQIITPSVKSLCFNSNLAFCW